MMALRFRREATRSWSNVERLPVFGVDGLPDVSDVGVVWAEVIGAAAVIDGVGIGVILTACWPRGGELVEDAVGAAVSGLGICWSGNWSE